MLKRVSTSADIAQWEPVIMVIVDCTHPLEREIFATSVHCLVTSRSAKVCVVKRTSKDSSGDGYRETLKNGTECVLMYSSQAAPVASHGTDHDQFKRHLNWQSCIGNNRAMPPATLTCTSASTFQKMLNFGPNQPNLCIHIQSGARHTSRESVLFWWFLIWIGLHQYQLSFMGALLANCWLTDWPLHSSPPRVVLFCSSTHLLHLFHISHFFISPFNQTNKNLVKMLIKKSASICSPSTSLISTDHWFYLLPYFLLFIVAAVFFIRQTWAWTEVRGRKL